MAAELAENAAPCTGQSYGWINRPFKRCRNMTDKLQLDPNDFQDAEKMKKIVRVLIMAVAKVPEEFGRDAIWGGLEALEEELAKPVDHRSFTQH